MAASIGYLLGTLVVATVFLIFIYFIVQGIKWLVLKTTHRFSMKIKKIVLSIVLSVLFIIPAFLILLDDLLQDNIIWRDFTSSLIMGIGTIILAGWEIRSYAKIKVDNTANLENQVVEADITPKPKKGGFFKKIVNKDDALKVIKECSLGYYVLAGIQAIIGIFVFPGLIIDSILYVVFAILLQTINSRIAAVLLLILSLLSASTTILNKLGITHEGGTNIILAIIIVYMGIRAVQATFKLKKLNETSHSDNI